MAGLQVVFQAILNLNQISFWFKKSRDLIFEDIERYKITNISGTPTFFKLIQPYDKIFPNVKRITLGGERASNLLINNLKSSFPNAKFNNIYATTEFGSLLISRGDIFEIPINKSNYIRIFDNQLQVFSKCENNESKWINTGDLVELINNKPRMFIFAARNINFVNIGGERINIEEIEDLINTLSYVKFCRVFERSTSIMNVLCVDIVLHDYIQKTNVEINSDFRVLGLLNGRCPQIIKLVESIDVTRTGKIKR
jgi:acyl-coenzyme A synthetase/AMP-(fatty) acid ligase